MDNILIGSKDINEHTKYLNIVFKRLRENKLYVSINKTYLYKRKLKYLGYILSAEGISIYEDKVKAINDWK